LRDPRTNRYVVFAPLQQEIAEFVKAYEEAGW